MSLSQIIPTMVIFRELITANQKYLLIIDHDGTADEKKTQLLVHTATHGAYIGDWPSYNYACLDEWSQTIAQGDDMTVHSLKSLIHTEEPRTTFFQTLGRRIISGEAYWGNILKLNGEFSFIENYWEWLEDVLGRSKKALQDAFLYEALYASLFTYDRNPNIVRQFCEAWCPETNTLHTLAGELSLSLWICKSLEDFLSWEVFMKK